MSVKSSDVHRQQPRAAAVLMQSSSCVNFPHSTDASLSGFTTQTAKPHDHVVVNTIVNTVVNTAFFFSLGYGRKN